MTRLYNLDYLRGISAFSIMIYHYLSWSLGSFSADTFLGRIGVYGVSIFYVLSGLTLYYVYFNKMQPNYKELVKFFKKRIYRIFPLLWLVTISSIIISKKTPNFVDLFLNLSGLFGFIKWDTYFSTGIWSIGNELVFYIFFPFFILFSKKNKPLMIILSLIIFGVFLYFAYIKLPNSMIENQWKNYTNPLNQVFLFLGGFLIGLFSKKIIIKNNQTIFLLLLAIITFIFYPISGDQFNLKIGTNRVIFSILSFIICFCFYRLNVTTPKFIHKPLVLLGEISYSIYLIHPIVYNSVGIIKNYTFNFSDSIKLPISIITTLLLSYFVYYYFERYFMQLGRK